MSSRFLGEIQILGFNFAPSGWAFAGGQTMAPQQNTALFSLLGTTYGGNGSSTFQLPNLVSRFACGSGTGPGRSQRVIGEPFGSQSVTLITSELPFHTHTLIDYAPANVTDQKPAPAANLALGFPGNGTFSAFAPPPPLAQMSPAMIAPAGGNQSHDNVHPFLGLNYSIALSGDFPQFS